MEENRIEQAYKAARSAGLCYNQKQFASLLGISPTTISRALANDARYITPSLTFKIEKILSEKGVVIGSNTGIVQNGENTITETSPDLSGMLAEMAAQREMYDRHLSEAFSIIKSLTTK